MISKKQALAEIAALARTHAITLDELASALSRSEVEAAKTDGFTLTRLFSYLGGIFIFSGLSAFIALNWSQLNSAARILVTLGSGVVCLVLATVMAARRQPGKNTAILFILSALLQATGLFVTAYEFATGKGDVRIPALAIFGLLAIQYGLFFFRLRHTVLLFFTVYFAVAAFVNMADFLGIPHDAIELVCGMSLIALSYGIQRTPYNGICGFGYFIGSLTLLWMGFDLVQNTAFELLYLAVACFMLYVSTLVRSRAMLATSTLALFGYISYFTDRHLVDSAGWPVCLILLGCIFLGVSNLALRLNKRLQLAEA